GIFTALTLLVFEIIAEVRRNMRSLGFLTFGVAIFVLLGAAMCSGSASWRALSILGLITSIFGWVVAFGWLADPNALSFHGFFKARLINIYLAASNKRRKNLMCAGIADAIPGDDVLLVDLKNCEK